MLILTQDKKSSCQTPARDGFLLFLMRRQPLLFQILVKKGCNKKPGLRRISEHKPGRRLIAWKALLNQNRGQQMSKIAE